MSTRVELTISEKPAPDDSSVLIKRLIVRVSFRAFENQFTKPYRAIVDTGAPTSLVPYEIWQHCPVLKIKETSISGIVDRDECSLPVIDGVMSCILTDGKVSSAEIVMRALLAPKDYDAPLLLGFGGLLEQATLYCSLPGNEAHLEVVDDDNKRKA